MSATLPIALLVCLVMIGSASGNEPASQPATDTTSLIDPAELDRSELSILEIIALKDQLAKNIASMLDQLDAEFPTNAPRPSIEIKGFANPALEASQTSKFEVALWRRDITGLLDIMQAFTITASYERLSNGALRFASRRHASAGARMFAAIRANDLANLDDIIENEQPDLEQYITRDGSFTLLLVSVHRGNVDAARRLLEAGANPDTRERGQRYSPLFQALIDGNEELIRLLGKAGADLDQIIGTDLRMSPIAWALAQGNIEHAALLIELGADPDVRDYAGWSALMDALYAHKLDAVELLLPVTDPLIISEDDITRRHRSKDLDVRFLPRGNALFLALRMRSPHAAAISGALRTRAAELDPEAGLQLLELSAQQSLSRLAWFEGRHQAAIDAHRAALVVADVPSITGLSNGDLITMAMQMLTELHEMLLINGESLTDEEYANVAHITELGGWHESLHNMLDILADSFTIYPDEKLDAWQANYGTPMQDNWNFDRLNTWVEAITGTHQRDQLFDVLDFFEQNGWRR